MGGSNGTNSITVPLGAMTNVVRPSALIVFVVSTLTEPERLSKNASRSLQRIRSLPGSPSFFSSRTRNPCPSATTTRGASAGNTVSTVNPKISVKKASVSSRGGLGIITSPTPVPVPLIPLQWGLQELSQDEFGHEICERAIHPEGSSRQAGRRQTGRQARTFCVSPPSSNHTKNPPPLTQTIHHQERWRGWPQAAG